MQEDEDDGDDDGVRKMKNHTNVTSFDLLFGEVKIISIVYRKGGRERERENRVGCKDRGRERKQERD